MKRPVHPMIWGLLAISLVGPSALSGAAPAADGAAKSRIDLSEYELTFDEPFDQLDVSAWGPGTRWISHTPWNGDFGDAQFSDPRPGFPFTVQDGILRIEARRGTDGKWRSGLLASADKDGNGFLQERGYFEISAKLPKGPGLWPAFWLIANKDPDTSVEVDVLEHYGKFPDFYESVVHIWPKNSDANSYHQTLRHSVTPGVLYEAFHQYGVSIEKDTTTFYFDRVEVASIPTPKEFNRPMFMLLNLAMGAGWPIDQTPSPSFMYVDYVRAYAKRQQ